MNFARPIIASMTGYVPGIQPDPREEYVKLNSNENPFPPSPKTQEVLRSLAYEDLRLYPDPLSGELRKKIGRLCNVSADQVICGNGSDDILNIIVRTFVQPGEAIGFHVPTFPLYRILGQIHGTQVVSLPIVEPFDSIPTPPDGVKVFFLPNPHSPLGFGLSTQAVAEMATAMNGILVVDEAYAEFARENALALVRRYENVLIVRTVSKSYSLAGVRLGYAIAREDLIAEMMKVKDPFNVTRLTQAIVAAAFEDQGYLHQNISVIIQTREWFVKRVSALGYRLIPSQANFIFPQPPQKGRGKKFFQALLREKVLTRHYDEEGLRDGVRMTIGTQQEMEQVVRVMEKILPELSE